MRAHWLLSAQRPNQKARKKMWHIYASLGSSIAPATSWKCMYAREMNCGESKHIPDRNELHMAHALCQCERVYRIIRGIRVASVATSSYQPITVTAIYSLDYLKPHIQYKKYFMYSPWTVPLCCSFFDYVAHETDVAAHPPCRCYLAPLSKLFRFLNQPFAIHARTYILCEFYIYILSLQAPKYLLRGKEKYEVQTGSRETDSRWNIVQNTKNFVCNLTAAAAAPGFFYFFIFHYFFILRSYIVS